MASVIKSVEKVTLTLSSGTNPASANLTKGQDWQACVPFFSIREAAAAVTDSFSNRLTEVWFDDNAGTARVNAQLNAGDDIQAEIFVVEWDTSKVNVQQGTFTVATSSATGTAAISDVDQAKAFIVFNLRGTSALGDAYQGNEFDAAFSSDTEITVTRHNGIASSFTGRYFVVECIGSEFSVQVANPTLGTSDTAGDDTISSVDTAKTFLVGGYRAFEGADDPRDGTVWHHLVDATTVRLARLGGGSISGLISGSTIFAITCADDEWTVQRAQPTISAVETADDTTVTGIDQLRSIVNACTGMGHSMPHMNTTTGASTGLVGLTFQADTTVRASRRATTTAGYYSFEVIQFAEPSAGVSRAPGQGDLAITGAAPSIARTDNRRAAPAQGSLALSGHAPVATVAALPVEISVPQGNAVLGSHAASVSATDNRAISPAAGALSLEGHALSAAATDSRSVSPGQGALALSGHTPVAATTDSHAVAVPQGNAALSGHAPSIAALDGHAVSPLQGQLALSGQPPAVAVTDTHTARPGQGGLLLSGHAPAASSTTGLTIGVPQGGLVLSGAALAAVATDTHTAVPGHGSLALSGHASLASATDDRTAAPASSSIVLSGHAPATSATQGHTAAPLPGDLFLSGQTPIVLAQVDRSVAVPTGGLTLLGHAPAAVTSTSQAFVPRAGAAGSGFSAAVDYDEISDIVRALYAEIYGAVEEDSPEAAEIAALVAAYVPDSAPDLPRPAEVDWRAIADDGKAMRIAADLREIERRLMTLKARRVEEIEDDEDDYLLMVA